MLVVVLVNQSNYNEVTSKLSVDGKPNQYGGWDLSKQAQLGLPHSDIHIEQNYAKLWLHFAHWNFSDSYLCIEAKAEQLVAKAQNYIGGGRHRTEKRIYKFDHMFIQGWGQQTKF